MNEQCTTLIKHPLKKLRTIGLLEPKSSHKQTLLSYIFLSCMTYIFIISFLQFFYMDRSILQFVDQAESFFSFTQTFSKLLTCFVQKDKFLNLCKFTEKFWTTDNCKEETKKRITNLSNLILFLQKVFFYAVIICLMAIIASVFFGRKLPLGTWSMTEYHFLYKLTLTITNIAFIFYCYFITNYDVLFVGFCFQVGNQFQILSDHLENLNFSNEKCNREKLILYIQQHSFLIRYFYKMKDTYSVTLIIQCGTFIAMLCAEIVGISQDLSYFMVIRYALAMYCITMQVAFFCIPAEYVTSQVAAISDGIYNSKWYLGNPGFKKNLIQMIMMSQKTLEFYAMGIFVIRASTLVTVFKIAMSTKTFLNNLNEK